MSDYKLNLDSLTKAKRKQNYKYNSTQSTGGNRRFCLHSESIKALEAAVEKRDRALSTALLQNEGFSWDFAFVATTLLMGGES